MPVAVVTNETKSNRTASGALAGLDRRLLAFAAIVFAVACTTLFWNLGAAPLFNPDEAYYAEPAREMNESGNYTITYLNYVVRHTKPPLGIWMMAGSYKLFGTNEFSARLFGAACGALLIVCAALWVRKYANERIATMTSAILLGSPLFIGVAREAIVDMPLALFTAGALMSFYHSFQEKLPRWKWVGYLLLAGAIMTKGPVGLVLPVAILGAYHLLRGEVKTAWNFYKPLQGLVLTALLAVPWFAIVIAKTHGAYFNEFIVRENFSRFTSVVDHKAPWWYHIVAMFGGLFPWSIFLPAACVSVARPVIWGTGTGETPAVRSGVASKVFAALDRCKSLSQENAFLLFNLITAVTILTFFSVSVSKLLPYTIPAFPAAAILIASQLDRNIRQQSSRMLQISFAALAVLLIVGLAVAPHLVAKLRDCPPALLQMLPGALSTLALASLIAFVSTLRKRAAVGVAFFASMLILSTVIFGTRAVAILADYWEEPIKAYSEFIGQTNWPTVVLEMRKPSVPFYAHRPVIFTDDKQKLEDTVKSSLHGYVIAKKKTLEYLTELGCKPVYSKGTSVLATWNR